MHSVQRIVLVASCLLCLAFLVHLREGISRARISPILGGGSEAAMQFSIGNASQKEDHIFSGQDRTHCLGLHGIEDLVIILKTGSTEIYEKLPIHFQTTFSCTEDYIIYSDVQQDFAGVPVRDAIALTSTKARNERSDLEQHKTLDEYFKSGRDAAELKGEKSWHLDKWKFLPMISDAYSTFEHRKKWYFFIEADTYVSMHNLLPWPSKLDSKQAIYAGAQVVIGETEFGHGGSGFLLSSTAAEALNRTYKSDQHRWEGVINNDCCGDKVMAEVLLVADPPIRLLHAFPLIQGETLASLDWSRKHWCMPAVTWHHVDAAGIDRLWNFDRGWKQVYGASKPILFRDYYESFIHPRLLAANGSMPDWDNLSNDWSNSAAMGDTASVENAKSCQHFCEQRESCLQWAWRPGSCKAGKIVRLGWALNNRPALGSGDNRIEKAEGKALDGAASGWMLDRIDSFRERMSSCDESQFWLTRNKYD